MKKLIKRTVALAAAFSMLTGAFGYTPAEKNNTVQTVSAADSYLTTADFVTRMYDVVLGRKPDSNGLQNWVTRLNNHSATAADIIVGFFNSQEYQGKKKHIEDQVTDCYKAMLARDPDSKGRKDWSQRMLVGMTINSVCNGFVGSQEFKNLCSIYGIEPGVITLKNSRDKNYQRTYFVYRLYTNCLGRLPDTAGLESWCSKLEKGTTGSQIAAGFLLSKEFKGEHYNNADYVYIMYNTMLGRDPDETGFYNWLEKLNYSDTREKVANGFLFSNEFKKQCADAGISVGNKINEKDSSQAWKYNIEVLSLVNKERTSRGLKKLTTRQDLWEDVAMLRASETVQGFDHTRPNGSQWDTAYDECGLYVSYAGENVAGGYINPTEVVDGWMHSPGHRSNILDEDFETLATGYVYSAGSKYRYYFVQNFMAE